MSAVATKIAVLDYGMGNLHSVGKALEHVAPHAEVVITESAADVDNADRVVFPGVGAMRDCMQGILQHGFDVVIKKAIAEKPVLGVCVGMQALFDSSDENGLTPALGILPGTINFFGDNLKDSANQRLKVPHMGWNQVDQTVDHPLWHNIQSGERFYFVHSYYLDGAHPATIGVCDYGVKLGAAVAEGNLVAVQFHPEKSHTAGLRLLENFVNWNPA